MPVVRNPQFYFREGLCWSDINTTYLKCRKKQKSIHDVKSMSIFGVSKKVSEDYLMVLINSTFISHYVDDFVNNTQTFQINDARQLPVIIPNDCQLSYAKQLVAEAIRYKLYSDNSDELLQSLQKRVDEFILSIYNL